MNLGPRRLRDVPNPVTVFQVQAPGLRDGFSAVADPRYESGEPAASGDQPDRARLGGRRDRGGGARTSAGHPDRRRWGRQDPAGTGGRRADWRTNSQTAYGFSSWRRSTDPAAVPDAVAAVLGITQQPGKTRDGVGGRGAGGPSPVAGVRQLRARPRCGGRSGRSHPRAIGDSADPGHQPRGIRRLADEQVWPVRSLGRRRGCRACSSSELTMWRPAFGRRVRDAWTEICRRLDGIPLAIELAASRMSSMTVDEIRDRLDHRFKLLVGSRRALGTSPDAAPRGGVVLRPARRCRKGAAGPLFGVRRRLRPRKCLRGSRIR